MFKFVRNEASFLKRQYHLQSFKVLSKNLDQKKTPPTLSHGEGRWGNDLRTMGESMVFYSKKVDENIKFIIKEIVFTKTQESRFDFYLNFILKPWCFPLGLYKIEYKNF